MKTKLISKRMLSLFVAVVMLVSLAISFAPPAVAIPDCTNPQCINPEINVCAGTVFNNDLLTANGVGCNPIPGTYLAGTDDEYNITVSYDFIQNPIPYQTGTDLKNTAPAPGTYYYHVYCVKYRTYYKDSCSCASVGYIYVYGCTANAQDFTVCVGDDLNDALFITKGNASASGANCTLTDIVWSFDTAAPGGPYEYTVICDSPYCGEKNKVCLCDGN